MLKAHIQLRGINSTEWQTTAGNSTRLLATAETACWYHQRLSRTAATALHESQQKQ